MKKSHAIAGLIGLFVLYLLVTASSGAGTDTKDVPNRPTTKITVSAEVVADVMEDNNPGTTTEFCNIISSAYSSPNLTVEELYQAFAEGYGDSGPPSARSVFNELLSRCS